MHKKECHISTFCKYSVNPSAIEKWGKLKELKTSVIHYKQQSSYWEWQFKQIKSRRGQILAFDTGNIIC